MRVLYVDSIGGLAGDMFLGAALDAGFVGLDELQSIVDRWLPERVRLSSSEVLRNEMRARTFRVDVEAPDPGHHHGPDHHDHGQDHHHHHHQGSPHRNLADVEALLDVCPMPPGAIARAKRMFFELAEAEAKVHGSGLQSVHFHEVGATDSLVDFAFAGLVLDRLACRVEASPALLGRGRVTMQHGLWPVPPPGTAEILRAGGIPSRALPPTFPWENAELTTPTGACLLRRADAFGDLPAGRFASVGMGAGTLDPPGFPNVVRLVLVETGEAPLLSRFDEDRVSVLETWIDDLPGNVLAAAVEELLAAGALDVAVSTVTLRKGRVGYRLEVIAPVAAVEAVAAVILGRTTAIGLRVHESRRWKLFREEARTADGLVGKRVHDRDRRIERVAPETEEVLRRAREDGQAPMFGWKLEDLSPR